MYYKILLRNQNLNCNLQHYISEVHQVLSTLQMRFNILAIHSKIIYLEVFDDNPQEHKFLGYRFKHQYQKSHFCDPSDTSRMFNWKIKSHLAQKDLHLISNLKTKSTAS